MSRYLERLHSRHANISSGSVATYIPELARADPSWFGIALATVDGVMYEVGDTRRPFTIQSISKPLTFGLALEDFGETTVRQHIGVEPTGDAFNSITLSPDTGRPPNPMVNSGAIVATSLIAPSDERPALERIVDHVSRYAGRSLAIDDSVFESERSTGHRNRAIAHLLRASGALQADPDETLERYFAQCSIGVDGAALATIAATLANGGLNPFTHERVASPATIRSVLSVMTTCGMYDSAGDWLYAIGLPAKSGVSGGILAVVPGQLGIGIFSPPLDAHGNSVRGMAVCHELARDLDLHLVGRGRPRVGPVRARHSVADIASKRLRTDADRAVIAAGRALGEIRELQGELTFLAAEIAIRGINLRESEAEGSVQPRWVVLDLRHVERVEPGAAGLLADLVTTMRPEGDVVLSGTSAFQEVVAEIDAALQAAGRDPIVTVPDIDRGREWCEDQVLALANPHGAMDRPVDAEVHELLHGIDEAGIGRLQARLQRVCYPPGTRIVRRGEAGDQLFMIVRGRLSVTVDLPGGMRRLSTMSDGMVFGELSLIGREPRTADVHADTMVVCEVLHADAFDNMLVEDPVLACQLLANLLRIVGRTARRMTDEVVLLAS